MALNHVCVWLDHREAKIFALSSSGFEAFEVENHEHPHHIHRKADHIGEGKLVPPMTYFNEVAAALRPYKAILIVGPGTARNEFAGHLVENEAALRSRIWGIEPMDHPTSGEIVAAARKFFRAAGRMHG